MILNLVKDIAILIVFFLLALLPIEIEVYLNKGYFVDPIKNTTILFICWTLAILIFITGKTVKWYFRPKSTHPRLLRIYPPPEWWAKETWHNTKSDIPLS